jgi:RNA polymerase sigma factor (sigma-70 family)
MEPWRARLEEGDSEAAWTMFLARYHRLVGATIARCIADSDDAMDAFAEVCDRLSADDLARLRKFHDAPAHRAKFSTWLVVVVRNLAIDFRRAREGRPRATAPLGLTPLRERIYQLVLVDRVPHVEAYESLRASGACDVAFPEFVREVASTYRAVDSRRWSHLALLHGASGALPLHETSRGGDIAQSSEVDDLDDDDARARVAAALAQLSDEDRAAIRLFVIEERPAADVASAVGLSNAKAVYNRVNRALAKLRTLLSADDSGSGQAK